jgi:glyoxylase-like metal-dependent hydrolase (beta-lactamase superfamily II)
MAIEIDSTLSRRRFFAVAGTLGAAAWLTPSALFGAERRRGSFSYVADGPVQAIRRAAANDPVEIHRLRGGISVLAGSGGNVAAHVGPEGVLLIDGGIVGAKIAAAIATLTRAPIRHVVNTHWHFDHTDANAWLHARGASIHAHENTHRHLSADTRVEDWDFTFPRSPADALPTTLVTSDRTLALDGATVAIRRLAPAHTDADLSVHFVDTDVLHVGDTWWNGLFPFIDYSTRGSIDGTIRATEDHVRRTSAGTIIVPGHGPVGGRADLQRYRDMLLAVRERVARLKARGHSMAEAVAARPTAAFDAHWTGAGPIGPDFFTRLVYKGV